MGGMHKSAVAQRPSAVIIGYGRMGREHERAYQECGVTKLYYADKSNWQRMVDKASDAHVSVCSYDDAHADQICHALERGHKVIAEKPLCLTEDDLKRIAKLATDFNLTCNLPLLHLDWPTVDIGHVSAEYIWGRANRIPEWRASCPGYSFVLGAGVHLTSLLLHLGGKISAVNANGQKTSDDIDCETLVCATGEFDDGGTFALKIDCGTVEQHRHRVVIDGRPIEHRDTDKTAEPISFIQGGHGFSDHVFAAHSVCFAIERALKSGKREEVVYLS